MVTREKNKGRSIVTELGVKVVVSDTIVDEKS